MVKIFTGFTPIIHVMIGKFLLFWFFVFFATLKQFRENIYKIYFIESLFKVDFYKSEISEGSQSEKNEGWRKSYSTSLMHYKS